MKQFECCSFLIPDIFLSSEVYGTSTDPNNPCLEDSVVYTCTTSGVLTWNVGTTFIGAYISGQGTTFVGATRTVASLPGVVANLTNMGETFLTSTLIISPAGTVGHESEIMCEGLSGIKSSTILHPIGEIAKFSRVHCNYYLCISCKKPRVLQCYHAYLR